MKNETQKSPIVRDTARLRLHEELCAILNTRNVYFQPPMSVKIDYPAIIYRFDGFNTKFADNSKYLSRRKYIITLIVKDSDSPFITAIYNFPTSRYIRCDKVNGMYHHVYSIIY